MKKVNKVKKLPKVNPEEKAKELKRAHGYHKALQMASRMSHNLKALNTSDYNTEIFLTSEVKSNGNYWHQVERILIRDQK